MQIVLMFPGTEVIASLRQKNPKNKFFGSFDEKVDERTFRCRDVTGSNPVRFWVFYPYYLSWPVVVAQW